MEVVGVRVEMPTNQPIVLLKETQGERYLPIWIGPMEATAIAYAQQGLVPVRPLTHDLLRDILEALDVQLRTVNITALRNGTFFADLIFSNGKEVSARPSAAPPEASVTGAIPAGTRGPDIGRTGRGSWFVMTHDCVCPRGDDLPSTPRRRASSANRDRDAPREIVDDLAGVGLRFETGTQVDQGLLVPGRRCAWR